MGEHRPDRAGKDSAIDAGLPADQTAVALAPLRDRIDAIDHEIVALLNERAEIALEIGRVKQETGRRTVRDTAREAQVLERVTSASAGLFPEPELVALYRKLIAATRRVQHAQKRGERHDGNPGSSRADRSRRRPAVGSDRGVTLTDGAVTLRPWRPGDARAVFAACQDPLIARFVPIPQPYTEADARRFVEIRARDWDADDERSFAIVDPATGDLLGAIARHGPVGHRATFGYWLAPEARGRGVATRALRLVADWTLATTGAIRLDLWTDLENDASRRVALRAGFEREGIRRAWDVDQEGRALDAVFYVLVRPGARG